MTASPKYLRHRRVTPIRSASAWREQYNPLSDLTPQRAVELYQAWRDGRYADVQLCWDALEEYDDILGTLVEKRVGALSEMDIQVKIAADVSDDNPELKAQAEAQKQVISDLYNRVVNIREAVEFLALASFRGYAHLEIFQSGDDIQLLPVDQWFWARLRRRGEWYYNPDANPSLGDLHEVDMSGVIVRTVARPIDIVAMFAITVKAHAEAGWDGFIDVFGNPALFFEYPPDTDDDQADLYDELINNILGDGRGSYPNGGKITPVETSAQGGITFQERADWANKKMVYKATGGLLTVMAESGTGTLAGSAHMDAFTALGRRDARDISECLNRQLTDRMLSLKFPGQRKLVYVTLEDAATEDVGAQVTNIVQLATAGYRVSDDTVSEITGMDVTTSEMGFPLAQNPAPAPLLPPITNRAPSPGAESAPLNSAEAGSGALSPEELTLLGQLLAPPTAGKIQGDAKEIEDELKMTLNATEKTKEETKE